MKSAVPKHYEFAEIRAMLPDGEKYGEVTLQLAKRESAWSAGSAKHSVYGPCTLVTQFRHTQIQQFVL